MTPPLSVRPFVWLIRQYQRHISPHLGRHCRFIPTCSQYALEALCTHGLLKGGALAVWRILRCNPFGRFGYDPVPPKGRWISPDRSLTREK
ncbi:MAG TPA: membrane protein insertion efficiency factor YidD [Candidatus Gemmiger faecigallinarum]|nr:membrane protein insertion efficiency factor YidD [Candidatus Gemmiger faecigallinarum]